jgi:hypothetical protein
MMSKKTRYTKQTFGSQTVWYDNELGGPIAGEPPKEVEEEVPVTTTTEPEPEPEKPAPKRIPRNG